MTENEYKPTLAEAVAEYEPAPDVDDLDTARRLITCLREDITRIIEESEPVYGEHTIFLDGEHQRMVEILYEKRKLAYEQEDDAYHEEYEFHDVFTDFVQGYIDVAWDTAQLEAEDPQAVRKPLTA